MEPTAVASGDEGSSRRALLAKVAVAGAGVAIYSSPIVSRVPAYGDAGLQSFNQQSGVLCVWHSPNQSGEGGQWHADIAPLATASAEDNNIMSITRTRDALGGTLTGTATVTLTFRGDPNSRSNGSGAGVVPPAANAGGLGLDSVGDSANNTNCTGTKNFSGNGATLTISTTGAPCEVNVEGVYCRPQTASPCNASNRNCPPEPWASGASNSIYNTNTATPPSSGFPSNFTGTVYYHTGRAGSGTGNGRCKFSILFRVRCV